MAGQKIQRISKSRQGSIILCRLFTHGRICKYK